MANFVRQVQSLPQVEQLPFVRGRLSAVSDLSERSRIEGYLTTFLFGGLSNHVPVRLIILIHGIRTQARWQGLVKRHLDSLANTKVVNVGYGYFNAFQFWLPGPTRKRPLDEVTRKVRDAVSRNPNSQLVIVAHSFGTYLTACMLQFSPDIRVNRLLMCGCILRRDFRWDKLPGDRVAEHVVNDVGSRDVWPIFAKIGSWGYGESGTFGFRDAVRVTDRFHDLGHSDFFTDEHVKRFWVPFVDTGRIVKSDLDDVVPTTSTWRSLLAIFPLKSVLVLVLVVTVAMPRLLA